MYVRTLRNGHSICFDSAINRMEALWNIHSMRVAIICKLEKAIYSSNKFNSKYLFNPHANMLLSYGIFWEVERENMK